MSDAAALIRDRLANWPALTALVGNRIYLDFAPDDTFPVVTFEIISDRPENSKDGYDRRAQRWEIDAWCHRGTNVGGDSADIVVANIQAAVEAAMLAPGNDMDVLLLEAVPEYERDAGVYRYRMDFSIFL